MFKVYDSYSNIIECEILFTFEENNKKYIVYLDEFENILASFYEVKENKLILIPIRDDEDFDRVDREILKRSS